VVEARLEDALLGVGDEVGHVRLQKLSLREPRWLAT
jgi:hypothetical protein